MENTGSVAGYGNRENNMNYTKKNTTYFATPKDDWGDRIEGDI